MSSVRYHASAHLPRSAMAPTPALLSPSPCAAQPPPAPELPTHHNSQQAPRATVATSSTRKVASRPTRTHHQRDQPSARHNQPQASPGETGNPWQPPHLLPTGSRVSTWWHRRHGVGTSSSRMGVGAPQNTTQYLHRDLPSSPGLQLVPHLGWAGPHLHPAPLAPTAYSRRGSPCHPCQGLLEKDRGEQLGPQG